MIKSSARPKDLLEEIRQHIKDLEQKFNTEQFKVGKDLQKYYEHMKTAEEFTKKVMMEGTNSHPEWTQQLIVHLDAARKLIDKIEGELEKEVRITRKKLK